MPLHAAPERPEQERRTIPREEDAPRPLIVLMIVLMLGTVAAAFLWIGGTEAAENVFGRPAPLARDGPIFTVEEILTEPAKGNLLGRDVAIWRAPVAEVSGNWLFWIGSGAGVAVPVVLLGEQTGRQQERETEVRAGDIVAVFGFVRAVRDMSLLDDPGVMRRNGWERLARERIYISALRVERLRAENGTPE